MPIPEYTYTPPATWTLLPHHEWLSAAETGTVSDLLAHHGYGWMAQSGMGEGGLGWFTVWQRKVPNAWHPRYAIEISQMDDEALVWIEALPQLWEFLRRYNTIGYSFPEGRDPEKDEPKEVVVCDDCQATLEAEAQEDERWRLIDLEIRRHDNA